MKNAFRARLFFRKVTGSLLFREYLRRDLPNKEFRLRLATTPRERAAWRCLDKD